MVARLSSTPWARATSPAVSAPITMSVSPVTVGASFVVAAPSVFNVDALSSVISDPAWRVVKAYYQALRRYGQFLPNGDTDTSVYGGGGQKLCVEEFSAGLWPGLSQLSPKCRSVLFLNLKSAPNSILRNTIKSSIGTLQTTSQKKDAAAQALYGLIQVVKAETNVPEKDYTWRLWDAFQSALGFVPSPWDPSMIPVAPSPVRLTISQGQTSGGVVQGGGVISTQDIPAGGAASSSGGWVVTGEESGSVVTGEESGSTYDPQCQPPSVLIDGQCVEISTQDFDFSTDASRQALVEALADQEERLRSQESPGLSNNAKIGIGLGVAAVAGLVLYKVAKGNK